MSVVVSFEDAGPCRKRLTIEVPAPAVEAEIGRVTKDIARQVRIEGFRRGKAPAQLIRRRFAGDIEKQVVERLVPRYWRQAEAEKSLDTLIAPEVSDLKIEDGAPMTFVAEVEVRPSVHLDLDAPFDLPEESTEASETEIDEAIEDVRRDLSTWTTVERPAAVGDRAIGTIRLETVDGEAPEEAAEETPLEVELGDQRVWEELTLALTGAVAGRTLSFDRKGEGEDSAQRTYAVEVREVQERELPPLDDAFAAKVGEFEDLAALRTAVAERIVEGKSEGLRRKRRSALLEQLRERHSIELPQRLVEQTTEEILQHQLSMLAQQGMDIGAANLDWQGLATRVRPDAEKRVHDRLVLDAVIADREMKVDEAAFEQLLAGLAAGQGKSTLALRQELSQNDRMNDLRAQFLRDQAVRSLLGETDPAGADADGASDDESDE